VAEEKCGGILYRVKALKRWLLGLILVLTMCIGGLYLVVIGKLAADQWFGAVSALAGSAISFYFSTRREEERQGRQQG